MAVYKRGYKRYDGSMTGRLARLLVLPKYAWRNLFKKRLLVSILILAMFWPMICIGFIYLSNNVELLVGFDSGFKKFIQVDSSFFLIFMRVQAVFSIIISIFAGPSLIAPDLSNNALQLYFSRPLSRAEYVFSRLAVLLGLLSIVTWLPGLIIFFMQTALAEWSWFTQNWYLGPGIFAGLSLWILLVSLIAMAGSAYVKKRIMAEAFILGIIFILPAVTNILNALFKVTWASLFNPLLVMDQIWHGLLGAVPESGPTVFKSWIALILMTALLLAVLRRKLRPVEVVS